MLLYLWITLFILAMTAAWTSNFFALPGNWLMLLLSIIWFCLTDIETTSHIGWQLLIVFGLLSIIGELLEFAASAFGTRKAGGSRKAATGGIIGAIAGSLLGAVFGIPVPIPFVGMIVGSLLFACVGASVGAAIGEKWQGSETNKSLKVGGAAGLGRLAGTLGKIAMGSVILVISFFSLFM
ncbi:MAG: DUF456 domain-containing protein [Planctomycetota bacterium]